jgi:hypothetical protein
MPKHYLPQKAARQQEGELFHAPVDLALEMLRGQTDYFLDQMHGANKRPRKLGEMDQEQVVLDIASLLPPTEEVPGG